MASLLNNHRFSLVEELISKESTFPVVLEDGLTFEEAISHLSDKEKKANYMKGGCVLYNERVLGGSYVEAFATITEFDTAFVVYISDGNKSHRIERFLDDISEICA